MLNLNRLKERFKMKVTHFKTSITRTISVCLIGSKRFSNLVLNEECFVVPSDLSEHEQLMALYLQASPDFPEDTYILRDDKKQSGLQCYNFLSVVPLDVPMAIQSV